MNNVWKRHIACTSSIVNVNIVFVVIYRPGSDNVSQVFFDELTQVLEAVAVFNSHVVITGDFNIKLNDIDNAHTKHLTELLNSFGLVQSNCWPDSQPWKYVGRSYHEIGSPSPGRCCCTSTASIGSFLDLFLNPSQASTTAIH